MSSYEETSAMLEVEIKRIEKTLQVMTEFYRSQLSIPSEIRDIMASDIEKAYGLGKKHKKLTTSLYEERYLHSFE